MDEGPAELMADRSLSAEMADHGGAVPTTRGSAVQVTLAVTLNAFCILPSFLLSGLSGPIGGELHLDAAVVGVAFSGFWTVASLTAFPLARLAERWGPVRALRVAGLVATGLCLVFALGARTPVLLVIALAVIGVTPALATPAVNMVIMSAVRTRRRALAFAVASASPVVALMVAGAAGPALEHLVGWRWSFVIAGAAAGVVAVAVRATTSAAAPAAPAAEVAGVRIRPLAVMMSGVLAGNLAIGAATAFLVLAAPTEGVPTGTASLAIAIAAGSSIVFRILLALLVDRRGTDPLPLCMVLLGCGACGYAALAIGGPAGFLIGLGLVLVPGWSWISLLVHGVMSRYRRAVAAASGVVQIAYFIGGVVGPAVFGALVTVASYRASWWVLVGANAIAITALAVGGRHLPRFGAD